MIVAVAFGVLIGVALGALGGGGSVLAVPVLVHLAGQSAIAATSTSLVAVGVASAVAGLGHARANRVRWDAAAYFLLTGIAGTWAGSAISGRLDGDVLLLGFSGLVLIAAHRMLTACPTCTKVGEERALVALDAAEPVLVGAQGRSTVAVATAPLAKPRWHAATRVVAAGSVVGFLTGLFGVGGGFVIVPALTLALGLSLPTAIGTSLVVIAGNTVIALSFRGLGSVDWNIAVPFTVTMLIGAAIGAAVAHRLPPTKSLQAFASLLVAVAIANGIAAALALAN
ncbi:MAG TPA: sulfite exporter TauE/SafE family protein [Ilumatobacter sp.]|nr:sulfite exporter TauE/SafE family protein [Ilumatobacter sp.]